MARFKVLAALAGSDRVLERFKAPTLDSSRDPKIIITALYQAAFGRLPEKDNLANTVNELRSGVSLEVLADDLVRSAEFQERHGSDENLDLSFITDLYLDGLGRRPDLESLGYWLSQGKKGATRADLLAAVAGSHEAADQLLANALDDRTRYRRWIAGNDTITPLDRSAILKHIAELPNLPFISVILPAGSTADFLRDSVNSLATQLYQNWELCIGSEEALKPELSRIAEDFKLHGSQVKLALSGMPGDMIAAINRGLRIATSEFVAFLTPGERLPEQALYEVAVALNRNPLPDIVYTDSDQIDSNGERFNPCFKSGFDSDLLLSYNYITNLVVYRRAFLEEVGLLRPDYKEAAAYDLILRATTKTTPDRIEHLPAVLYHERHEADNFAQQLPVIQPGNGSEHAVRDFLDRRGDTDVSLMPIPSIPGALRVVWPLPAQEPLVSIILPTRDRANLLSISVEGVLHRTDYANLEILIVDNESSEQNTLDLFDRLFKQEGRLRILSQPGPFNYSALNNAAARAAQGEVLVLLNNDIDVINAGWLRELVSHAIRPDVGAVGAKLLYKNETVQHGGIMLGPRGAAMHIHRFAERNDPGYFGQLALTRTLSAVTGACLAIRRNVYLEVGGLDEVNLPVSFNDVDLCLRVQAHGYRVVWTPFAELIHLESVSRGVDKNDPEKYKRAVSELRHLRKKWQTVMESGDSFHNPNIQFGWNTSEIPSPSRRERPWISFFLQNLNKE